MIFSVNSVFTVAKKDIIELPNKAFYPFFNIYPEPVEGLVQSLLLNDSACANKLHTLPG